MPAQTLANPYRGINAHLHSIAQNPSSGHPTIWTSFHAHHIGHLVDNLNLKLPSNYIARPEQSLQIWTEDESDELSRAEQPRPDVAVFRTGSGTGYSPEVTELLTDENIRLIPIAEMLAQSIVRQSVGIYEVADHEFQGQPITRIELLSNDNKKGSKGYAGYLNNRLLALQTGTSLIELDYLHQTASPLPGIPAYPDEHDSHAYTIAVTDMRHGHNRDSVTVVYNIDVDNSLPTAVRIPLARDDVLNFDFDTVYQHTFTIGRWGINLDYALLPRSFDTYSPKDQNSIRQVMQRVQQLEKAE